MKVRTGFVSNSSSSSFICEVCGEIFSAYDYDLSDFDLVECEEDHLLCSHHILKPEGPHLVPILTGMLNYLIEQEDKDIQYIIKAIKAKESITEYKEEIISDYHEYSNEKILSVECPVCTLQTVQPHILLEYIEYKYGIKRKDYVDEIRNNFTDLEALLETLKGKRK